MEFSFEIYFILLLVAFIAGFVSAIAGGGGIIILPVLLAIGLPPLAALATTKVQGFIGVLSSTSSYYRRGFIDLKRLRLGLVCAAITSAIGVILVHQIDTKHLEVIIPLLLIFVCGYILMEKRDAEQQYEAKLTDQQFNLSVGSTTGFYIGMFGPGIGSMLIVAFRSLRGESITRAVANAKPLILSANLVATIAFALSGHVWWLLGISMALTQAVAAKLGTRFAIGKGSKVVKPLMVVIAILAALKVLVNSH